MLDTQLFAPDRDFLEACVIPSLDDITFHMTIDIPGEAEATGMVNSIIDEVIAVEGDMTIDATRIDPIHEAFKADFIDEYCLLECELHEGVVQYIRGNVQCLRQRLELDEARGFPRLLPVTRQFVEVAVCQTLEFILDNVTAVSRVASPEPPSTEADDDDTQ